MSTKPIINALVAVIIGGLTIICRGQSEAEGSRVFSIGDTEIHVVIPVGVNVSMAPYKLTNSGQMSMLFYRASVAGRQPVYGLHWRVYVSDADGKLIGKDSWWDRGEWPSGTEVDSSTVFECENRPGTKLLIVLQEVIDAVGVRSVDLQGAEKELNGHVIENISRLSEARLTRHVSISDEESESLLTKSLNIITSDRKFRRGVPITGRGLIFLTETPYMFYQIPDVELMSREQVQERLRNEGSLKYLEYCCLQVEGRSAKVTFNYHTPDLRGTLCIDKGIRLEFSYYKTSAGYILKGIRTEHF